MKNILLLFIVFATHFNAQSQEWKLLDDNDEYKLFIRDHSQTSAWFKWEYKKVKINEFIGKKEEIKKTLTLYKFDCNKKMLGTLASIHYDEKGETIRKKDNGDYARMENAVPDTLGEWVLLKFCKSKG